MMNGKITKRERFEEMVNIFTGLERTDLVEFCKNELELLAKKSAKKGNTKKAKEQLADMEFVFAELVTVGRPVTITELIKIRGLELSNQKVSAMLKKLIELGKVQRVEEKKVAYFSAIDDDDTDIDDTDIDDTVTE